MMNIQRSEKYRANYNEMKSIVNDSFCELELFLQNALDLYGFEKMIKKIYDCESSEEIKKLVFTII